MKMSPEELPELDPVQGQAHGCAARQSLQLRGQKRGVGGHHNDDGADIAPYFGFQHCLAGAAGMSLPMGTPAMVSCGRRPQLHCTSTPTV